MNAMRSSHRGPRADYAVVLFVVGASAAGAQTSMSQPPARAESLAFVAPAPLFRQRDLVYSTGVAALTGALMPFDRQIAATMTGPSLQRNRTLSRSATVLNDVGGVGPIAIGAGLFVIGRLGGWDRVAALGLHGTEAVVFSGAITGLLKGTFGRTRPFASVDHDPSRYMIGHGFSDGRRASLPSGHATAAFALAAVVSEETAVWWPDYHRLVAVLTYGGATGVALARLYSDQHWASDVVLGAGIGTLTGLKVVSYAHSRPGSLLDRGLRSTTVIPTPRGAIIEWSLNTP
ncbi:MAG: phosphatase PAP2 family protein [Gemmatimonadaceae bacterium]